MCVWCGVVCMCCVCVVYVCVYVLCVVCVRVCACVRVCVVVIVIFFFLSLFFFFLGGGRDGICLHITSRKLEVAFQGKKADIKAMVDLSGFCFAPSCHRHVYSEFCQGWLLASP